MEVPTKEPDVNTVKVKWFKGILGPHFITKLLQKYLYIYSVRNKILSIIQLFKFVSKQSRLTWTVKVFYVYWILHYL